MSVLVTGALGYIGSGIRSLIPDCLGVDHVSGSSFHSCISDFKIPSSVETIIHLADSRLAELNENNWQLNVEKHRKFIEELRRHSHIKRVVFSSSCSVYGHQEGELDENSPVMATSWYAKSKIAVEEILKASSLPFVICRFGTAYGASSPMRWDLLPNVFGRQVFERTRLEVYDPESLRPYTHVDDIRRGLLFAADRAPLYSVLNFAGENFSKESLLSSISVATRQDLVNIEFNLQKKEVRNYRVNSKTVTELGFSFQNSVHKEFSRWNEDTCKELS